MKINLLTVEEVFRSLVTSERGLSRSEAERRLGEFGPNEIREAARVPLWRKFLSQFTHFLAVLLWIGAGLSFVSEHLNPGSGMLSLGLAIVGVIFINAVFTFVQEYRAEKSVEKLRKLLPFSVKVVRDGAEASLPAKDLVPGDLILLGEGDKVPADSRVIESIYLSVNNAALTGESGSVLIGSRPIAGDFMESRNIVLAGAMVTGGRGRAVVFATGMRTEFGRIAHLTSTVEPGLSPLQREIVKVTRFIAFLATVSGCILFLLGHLFGRSFWENFIFTIGLIIANVPEGLLPTVTLALVMGSRRMLKKKALIKTLTSVETLGSVTVICTDKTGTLTQNRMSASKVWADGRIMDPAACAPCAGMLMLAALLCNNARRVGDDYLGDPTESALLKFASEGLGDISAERISEIPFDSDRKRMTTLNRIGPGLQAFSKGAMESILPLCTAILVDGREQLLDETGRAGAMAAYHRLMDRGLRVLAFAFKDRNGSSVTGNDLDTKSQTAVTDHISPITHHSSLESDLVFLGLIGLEDPPRAEVPEALRKCHEAGIRVIMITGDGSRTASAIAREIGLVRGEPVIVEGADFLKMDDRELKEKLASPEVIFSRMTPKHKMRVVSVLQDEGERVAVTGDGVNDAPALKKADIGIAMGLSGTDVAKEAADMILLDDNFATIVNAVEEGRTVFENIRKFITYIFAHGTPEAVPYIMYALFNIPLPLTVMQILAIDLGTETIPALALGAEPSESNVMKLPPRPSRVSLIDRATLFKGYVFLGGISTVGVLIAYFHILLSKGWTWGTALPLDNPLTVEASTATFLGIVIMQIGTVFACRTQSESVFRRGIFGNKMILWGIAAEVLLSAFIIYHPWGNRIFSTAPVPLQTWLLLVPFMLLVFFSDELRKWFPTRSRTR